MTHETRDERALLRHYLSGRDVHCPACDYNLRNTEGSCCPECGRALSLRVSAVPRLGAYSFVITSIAAPVGFAGTVAAPGWYRVIERYRLPQGMSVYYGWDKPDWLNLAVSTAVVFLGLVLLRIAVWQSRRFIALSKTVRWLLAGLAGVASIGAIYGLVRCYARIYLMNPYG